MGLGEGEGDPFSVRKAGICRGDKVDVSPLVSTSVFEDVSTIDLSSLGEGLSKFGRGMVFGCSFHFCLFG